MKFEYTVRFNGRKYFPGEDVPMEPETETVTVAEEVAVDEPVKEEPVVDNVVVETKSKGRKKKSS